VIEGAGFLLSWHSWAEALGSELEYAKAPGYFKQVQLLRTRARSLGASAIALRYSMSPCSGSFWCDRGLEGRPYGQRARRVRSPFWLMCRKTGGVVLRVVNGGLGWSRARFVVVAVFAYVGLSLVGAPRALCCFGLVGLVGAGRGGGGLNFNTMDGMELVCADAVALRHCMLVQ
jgi:hypothetical protein